MRIAMLSWRLPGDPRAGGAERLTFELLKRAVDRGHEVTWFAARSPGARDEDVVDGVRFVRRGRQWTVHVHAWLWLRRRQNDFDIVVDQVNTLPFLTPLYVPEARRRLLIYQTAREYWWRETRGLFRLLAPFGYLAEPQYLKLYRSTRAITISASTEEELVAVGLPRGRIRVVAPAVSAPVLAELGAKAGPLRLIVIGRLTPAKFVEEAVDAFARVRALIPEAVLDLVGSGDEPYRERLERDVANRGLGGAVSFHGRVSEERKYELLERSHVHVFTSHREGWGLTVDEAGARGTPTVGYDVPGVRDSVSDPRLLVPLDAGPQGLAERLASLAGDSALYEDARRGAWSRARALSFDASADAFLRALGP